MNLEAYDAKKGVFRFRMPHDEYAYFADLLSEYPRQTGAPHRISADASGREIAEQQKLLEESLEEHRKATRAELEKFLNNDKRLVLQKAGWKLTLDEPGIDWLLQILNDIRIGSWVELGRPDAENPANVTTPEQMRRAAAMQLCGLWQGVFLHALEHREPFS